MWHRFGEKGAGRKGRLWSTALLLGLAVVGGTASDTWAQHWPQHANTNEDVTWMRFMNDGWIFAPAGLDTTVRGFLAWTYDADGDNIRVLWYQREEGDHWSTWGWDDDTALGDAAAWVEEHLGGPLVFVEDPDLREPSALADRDNLPVPQQMMGGLFVGDPAHELVLASPDPALAMETLVAAGYPAAPLLSPLAVDASAPCAVDDPQEALEAMLNDMAATFEVTFFGETEIILNCAWPCAGCTRVYGPWGPGAGPWGFVRRIPRSIGMDECQWSRPGTRTWTEVGLPWFLCNPCTGTGTDPGPETTVTSVPRGDPCIAPP